MNNLKELHKDSYPEWWRDWPNEARQPACSILAESFSSMVLIPAEDSQYSSDR